MGPFPRRGTKTLIGNGLALRHLHLPPPTKSKTATLATNEGLIEFLQGWRRSVRKVFVYIEWFYTGILSLRLEIPCDSKLTEVWVISHPPHPKKTHFGCLSLNLTYWPLALKQTDSKKPLKSKEKILEILCFLVRTLLNNSIPSTKKWMKFIHIVHTNSFKRRWWTAKIHRFWAPKKESCIPGFNLFLDIPGILEKKTSPLK